MAEKEIDKSERDRSSLREQVHVIETSVAEERAELHGLRREIQEVKTSMVMMNGKIDTILQNMPKRTRDKKR